VLVVERFGQVQTTAHASPERAMGRPDGPPVEGRDRKVRVRQTDWGADLRVTGRPT
jgi:hypothetical protein